MNGTRAPTGPDTATARPWHHVEAKPFGPEHILPLLAPCAEGAHALAEHPLFAAFQAPQPIAVDDDPAIALGHLMARLSAETADRWDGWEAVSAALLQLILVEASRAVPGRGTTGSKLVSLLERRRQRRPRSS